MIQHVVCTKLIRRLTAVPELCEAGCLLAAARIVVLLLPFRSIAAGIGCSNAESTTEAPDECLHRARRVRQRIHQASRFLPWQSSCLVKSLAAIYMLRRRGLEGTVYLGLVLDQHQQLRAHAWVRYGCEFVVGGRDRPQFVRINSFTRASG